MNGLRLKMQVTAKFTKLWVGGADPEDWATRLIQSLMFLEYGSLKCSSMQVPQTACTENWDLLS